MEVEVRKELHRLLDKMIDEDQPIGTFSFMQPDDEALRIKTYKLFLNERDFLPGT